MKLFQEIYEDLEEYANIYNLKCARNGSLVQVAHQVYRPLQQPSLKVPHVVQIPVKEFLATNDR